LRFAVPCVILPTAARESRSRRSLCFALTPSPTPPRSEIAGSSSRTDSRSHASQALGVRVQVVNEVVRAWDYDEGAFRALAAAWLELNRAAVNRSLSTVGEQA